ncbi:MAG: hypothetical protein M1829_001669 [Trizodia sp. TS-e1964]|nr:MAG: hypothetical protein M1829_001669 [Trizodia sp. TS-e1964]
MIQSGSANTQQSTAEGDVYHLGGGRLYHAQNQYFRPKPIIQIPFDRNDGFVNRKDIFKDIDHLLSSFPHNRSAALWGLGGSGKTQVALEYAYRYQDNSSCSIFWIHAESEARFVQSYSELGTKAKLPVDLKGQDLLRAVQEWIEQQKDWLLVLDNADDLEIFKTSYSASQDANHQKSLHLLQFVPRAHSGIVLWTSRDAGILGSIISLNRGVKVGAMSLQESWYLFQTLCGNPYNEIEQEPSQEIEELIDHLQKLPLAISQAASYIRKTQTSVQHYLKLFCDSESEQLKLLNHDFQDAYRLGVPNSVMLTWKISMKQIAKESPIAVWILNVIAFFDTKGISRKLLKLAARSYYEENRKENDEASDAINKSSYAMQGLRDRKIHPISSQLPGYHTPLSKPKTSSQASPAQQPYSDRVRGVGFSNTESGIGLDENISLPKLSTVGEDINKNCNKESKQKSETEYLLAVNRLVEYSFLQCQRSDNGETPYYEQHRLVQLATRWALSNENLINIFSGHALNIIAGTFPDGSFETWDGCGKCLPHALKVVECKEARNYKSVAPFLMADIGRYYWEQGRSNEAEQLQVEVLELQKEVLGPNDPHTITARANLAATWRQQGRLKQAENLLVEVLEFQKEVLGPNNPKTIRSMAHLAATLWQQGRSNEAEELDFKVLKLRIEALGPKDPDTITAMINLASTWCQQGRLKEAEELQVRALVLRNKSLGPKHLDTITAMASLAATWWQQGRFNEAEKLQVEVIELQKEVLGPKHPDTIKTMANLASTWWQQGQSNKAEKLQVEVLELRKETLSPKHPDTITAMANIATIWWQQGRYIEAEKLHVEVLELRKKVLGPKHPNTLTAMVSLALAWWDQSRPEEAYLLLASAIEQQKEILGIDHPDTRSSIADLSRWNQHLLSRDKNWS